MLILEDRQIMIKMLHMWRWGGWLLLLSEFESHRQGASIITKPFIYFYLLHWIHAFTTLPRMNSQVSQVAKKKTSMLASGARLLAIMSFMKRFWFSVQNFVHQLIIFPRPFNYFSSRIDVGIHYNELFKVLFHQIMNNN